MALLRSKSSGFDHHVQSLSRSGDRLVLDDGSTWALDPADLPRVRCWTRSTKIAVVKKGTNHWLVARCDSHQERVLVGFRGHVSESADILTSWQLGIQWSAGQRLAH